jgi:CIC family chloride channel protein
MGSIIVSDVMVKDVVTFDDTITAKDAELMITSRAKYRHRGFPVVDQKGDLVGMVTRKDIIDALINGRGEVSMKEIMTKDIAVCYPDETLKSVLQKLGEKDIGRVPVVEKENTSHLEGLITRENIIDAYNKELKKETETKIITHNQKYHKQQQKSKRQ